MSGYIFAGDRANYNNRLSGSPANKVADDQGQNGAIKALFRLVTKNDATGEGIPPQIQHVEMGRDQAHGAGDLTNSQILARLMLAQDTKVDPVTATPSTESNAVGPYEFLDDRMRAVHELWGTFMVGYDIPWVPVAMSVNPDGSIRAMYNGVAGGRIAAGSPRTPGKPSTITNTCAASTWNICSRTTRRSSPSARPTTGMATTAAAISG